MQNTLCWYLKRRAIVLFGVYKDNNDLPITNQVREIKEAFLVFDDNGDGCISATELKKLVTSLGYNITEAELMDMMNQIGTS